VTRRRSLQARLAAGRRGGKKENSVVVKGGVGVVVCRRRMHETQGLENRNLRKRNMVAGCRED
jgi:hypothetical protein